MKRYQKLLDEAEAKENEELGLVGPRMKRGPVQTTLGNFDLEKSTLTRKQSLRGLIQLTWTRMVGFIVPFVGEILNVPVTQRRKCYSKLVLALPILRARRQSEQLEEARRLAVLQKKRERKAAGIMYAIYPYI